MTWFHKFLLSPLKIELLYIVIRRYFHILPGQCFQCQAGLVIMKLTSFQGIFPLKSAKKEEGRNIMNISDLDVVVHDHLQILLERESPHNGPTTEGTLESTFLEKYRMIFFLDKSGN